LADNFSLSGSYSVSPLSPPASADFDVLAVINESEVLQEKSANSFDLSSDSPFTVPFGSVASASVMIIKVVSGLKIVATITTADGTAQTIPVDSFLAIISEGSPVTALLLTRTPATDTSVRVFLGEMA
jgi:hypothetical protein